MGSEDLKKQFPPSSTYFADVAKYAEIQRCFGQREYLETGSLTVDDMKTEDGFLAALKKVKDMKLTVDGQPVIPLQLNGKNYHGESLQFLQRSFGAIPIDKDGKFREILLSPENKHAVQFLFKTAQGGYFDPGQLTTDNAAWRLTSCPDVCSALSEIRPALNLISLISGFLLARSCRTKAQNLFSLTGLNQGKAGCKPLFPNRPRNRNAWRNGSAL